MKPIGVAVVGFGRWGANLARVIAASSDLDLLAIVDTDPSRRSEAERQYPAVVVVEDIDRILELSAIAALAIATPPQTLFSLSAQAIERGRHVFAEKPGATTSADALFLDQRARSARRVLFVDLTPVWSPLQKACEAVLASGGMGALLTWRAERTNLQRGQPGIDVLRDLAIHDLAVLDALVPARPTSITIVDGEAGLDGRLVSARMRLLYPDGLAAEIVVSWVGAEHRRRTTIVGSEATLVRDDVNDPARLRLSFASAYASGQDGGRSIYPEGGAREPLALALQAFAVSIRTGSEPPTGARAAARALDWIAEAERTYGLPEAGTIRRGAAR